MPEIHNSCFATLQVSTQIEYDSLMNSFDWKPITIEGDSQQYYECFFESKGKKPLRLIAAMADEMGNTAAAVLSLKLNGIFHPKFMILTGIAAGVKFIHKKNQPVMGDVVIADRVWNFSSGKYVPRGESPLQLGNIGFIPRPNILRISPELRKFLKEKVKVSHLNYKIHIGAMASGSAVISNREIIANYILPIVEKTKGLDMESYGVFYTSEHAIFPRPIALVVKGICDFADDAKCDEYQSLAAGNSCNFLNYLLSEVLPEYQSGT